MRLMCFDPGKDTGIAVLSYDPHTPVWMEDYASLHERQVSAYLRNQGNEYRKQGPLAVVMERFDLQQNIYGVSIASKQVQGRILSWAEEHQVRVYWQMPLERLSIDREVLLNLGLWLPGKHNRHIMDATRHGVMHLQRAIHMPTLLKGWPQ